jgi:F0F1-type ATP synthase membrane subunit c/vacuolar-type H+-ATPase subunit K
MGRARKTVAAMAVAVAAALAALSAAAQPSIMSARCFGAAARDRLHPCTNPKLRLVVTPMPAEARMRPNSP